MTTAKLEGFYACYGSRDQKRTLGGSARAFHSACHVLHTLGQPPGLADAVYGVPVPYIARWESTCKCDIVHVTTWEPYEFCNRKQLSLQKACKHVLLEPPSGARTPGLSWLRYLARADAFPMLNRSVQARELAKGG